MQWSAAITSDDEESFIATDIYFMESTSQPTLFFISGLGADAGAFDRIELEGYHVVHLHWLIPERGETMHSYAKRMAAPIIASASPVVIGVSLGGMLASEMTSFVPQMRAIIISSIKAPEERSFILKVGHRFPVHGLMPIAVLKKLSFLWRFAKRNHPKADVDHMIGMFLRTDNRFMRWGMLNAPRWKGRGDASRIHHIHGDDDKLFPVRRIKNCEVIEGGTHLMVYQRGHDVTLAIRKVLSNWYPPLR
jgi:pimeloyl-ACP methyl ester carboxylesterase